LLLLVSVNTITMSAVKEPVLLVQQQQQQHTDDAMALKSATTTTTTTQRALDIIDIQNARIEVNLKDEILAQMNPEQGPRTLPTLLLYDERGLQLFEEVSLREPIDPNPSLPAP
jgi:hypothetical protein